MQAWMMMLPLALLAALAAWRRRGSDRPLWTGAALLLTAVGLVDLLRRPPAPPQAAPPTSRVSEMPVSSRPPEAAPPRRQNGEFAGSQACQSCHPSQHASWHDSYHRTMTQPLPGGDVLAPFDNVELRSKGRTVRLSREGDDRYAEMVDPEWETEQRERDQRPLEDVSAAPRVRRKVVMSTGSHHFQTYWIRGERGNSLWQVPWVYHLPTQRWMPAEEAFVAPPEIAPRLTLWNDNCIQCHVVAGHPGADADRRQFDSTVADYGIACEACHGPGRRHVEHHAAGATHPAAALANTTAPKEADPTIVNPARLDHRRSSQVCGQCHSYFSFADAEFWTSGFKYRAGDDLLRTRYVHHYSDDYVQERDDLLQGYWGDGSMRIAGREFAAMDDSACYLQGELSCISCHAMHQYEDPSDQLAAGMRSNQACVQCHPEQGEQLAQHTHHAPDSIGSNCYNCHMPHTSFGLLKAIRSHRIDSPTAEMTLRHGRPNACNLCHADQTLQWTADHLAEWYGQAEVQLPEEQQQVSALLLTMLRGDAVQRAVAAANLGSDSARETAGDWQPAYLTLMLADPYAAVRFAAHESLRKFPGYEDVGYDFLAPPAERARAMAVAAKKYSLAPFQGDAERARRVLLRSDGVLQIERVQVLMQQRDDRPVMLPE